MNKIITFIIVLFSFLPIQSVENPNSLKIRSAVFIPQSKLFRKIYHTVGPCIELEYAYRFRNHVELWGNFDWFWHHGKSVGLCSSTKIKIPNFSFGIKSPFTFKNCHEIYLGIGPSFAGIFLSNNSCCGCEKISKEAIGVIIKSGYYYNFNKRIFLDLFADYLYQSVHFQRKVNVGGLKMGAGLGIRF